MCPAHPELSIDGDHGEEQHHGQRAPEVRVISDHLAVVTQRRHWHQYTADLVVDVLQVNVQLLPAYAHTHKSLHYTYWIKSVYIGTLLNSNK